MFYRHCISYLTCQTCRGSVSPSVRVIFSWVHTFKVFCSNSIWMVGMIGLFAWLYESVHKSWYLHCSALYHINWTEEGEKSTNFVLSIELRRSNK